MLPAATAPAADTTAAALGVFAARASVEVTPKAARPDEVAAALRPGSEVFLTHLPDARIEERARGCRALRDAGMRPMPHVAAKEAVDAATLDGEIARLLDAGATGIMLIGGGGSQKGPFRDSGSLLASGVLQRRGVTRLGLAGHPEGHPQVDEATLEAALRDKLALAASFAQDVRIVTQFVFDAKPLVTWLERIRSRGITAPVRVGLPGPATPATLLSFALRCGVGPSLKALQNRPSLASRMRRRWRPDALAAAVAETAAARPELGIDGLHVFPFGGLAATGEWLTEAASRTPETVAHG
jgi:methylenetetrahydrofolate reductase (NADPH)